MQYNDDNTLTKWRPLQWSNQVEAELCYYLSNSTLVPLPNMRTTDYTKPNRPINFLPNSCVRDIKKPIWGLFTPWDQNIWAPPLFRNQLYGTHTSSNLSWAETRNRGSNVAISTRQTILAHPCPPELDLMNMVIMGNHSINAARSNFLWFSPRYPPPSDSISTDSTTMKWIFFSHP